MRLLDSITDSMEMNLSKLQQIVKDREAWCVAVHRIAKRSNQSILKEINPEYSLEGLILKLNLHYSGHLMQRANSEKDIHDGKD